MLSSWYLTILPLPDPAEVATRTGPFTQWIPFRFVYDFISETKLRLTDIHTWLPALKQGCFMGPIFNVALTIPFGMYLAYYFRKSMKATVIGSFLLSLFFELTQLSGLYGIYPRPYRLFDVDDLMLNTVGGILGFLIAKRLAKFLPSRHKIDEDNLKRSAKVGYIRRVFAFGIDYLIITVAMGIFWTQFNSPVATLIKSLVNNVLLIAYFILCHRFFKRTLGKLIVHIRLEHDQNSRPLLLRYGILFVILSIFPVLNMFMQASTGKNHTAMLLTELALWLLIGIDFLVGIRREKRLFYERISRMRNVNTKKLHAAPVETEQL
jgi:glycopeptide antibiotics resistance protein